MTLAQMRQRHRAMTLAAKRNLTPEDVQEMRELTAQRQRELSEEAQLDREQNEPFQPEAAD